MFPALVIAVVALNGCALEAREGEDQALEIVWAEVYKATCQAPRIVWAYDCTTKSGKPGVNDEWGRCVAGVTFFGVIKLVWLGSFAESAFAHELLHSWQGCRGIVDSNHEGDEWKTLFFGAVAALRRAGL